MACTCHGEEGEGYSRGTHSSRSRSRTRTRSKSGSGGQGRVRSSRRSTFSSRSRSQSPNGSRSRSRNVHHGQDMQMMPCMRRKFLDGDKSSRKNLRQSRSRSRSVNHGRGRSSTRKSTFASRSRSRSPSENRSKIHFGQDMKLMPSLAQKGLAREKADAENHKKAAEWGPSSPKPSILKKPDHPEVKTVINIPIRPVSPSWRYGSQAQISNKENCRVCAPHPCVMQKGGHSVDGKHSINVPITVHGPKPQLQGLKNNTNALKSSTKVDINIPTKDSACDHFGYAALPCCFDFNLIKSSTSKSSFRKEKRSSSVHLYQMNSSGKFF